MIRIGVLSDTHGALEEKFLSFFADTDEIWHAGDIGSLGVLERLRSLKPVRAVYGNIDGAEIRDECKASEFFSREGLKIWLVHIAPNTKARKQPGFPDGVTPDMIVCGHSHILKVAHNDRGWWMLNPGAAGNYGFHKVKTAIRFCIDRGKIKELEILEIPRDKH